MEAPSEKCAKCNWWLLLGEIRDEFEVELRDEENTIVQSIKYHMKLGNNRHSRYTGRTVAIDMIVSILAQSAHKVCKEHWDGKI